MAIIRVKGHDFEVLTIKDSFDRRALQFINNIIKTLSKINVNEDNIDIKVQPMAVKYGPASASWYFDGRNLHYSYKSCKKYVENLYVVFKVIEIEVNELILGKKITLNVATKDNFGRQIASVWSGRTWIDKKLIETGWVAYSSSTQDPKHILQNIDWKNREKKIGIYSELCTQYENKEKPKCVIKGNISGEWERKGEKNYHFPGCMQYGQTRIEKYRGEQWFCTEKEAIAAGYTKSGGCGAKSWK